MQETREKNLEVRNLIGGVWEEGNGRATEPVYDPATGESWLLGAGDFAFA